jgi:predicted esterase
MIMSPGKEALGDFKHRVVELLARDRREEARDAVLEARLRYPRQRALAVAWAAETLCRLDEPDTALDVLAEALDGGVWWWEQILRNNPPLAPLQGRSDFEEMIRRSESKRVRSSRALPPIVYPPATAPVGVLIPLHGRNDHHASFARRWEAARNVGFLVVVPTSAEATTSDGDIGWIDEEKAKRQVQSIRAGLSDDYRHSPVILSGYSQGARLAADWALSGALPQIPGFVVVSLPADCPPPTGPAPVTRPSVRPRGYVMTGEHDDDRPAAERFAAHLTERGVTVHLEVMAGMGHSFPPNFADRLPIALSHVIQGDAVARSPASAR